MDNWSAPVSLFHRGLNGMGQFIYSAFGAFPKNVKELILVIELSGVQFGLKSYS